MSNGPPALVVPPGEQLFQLLVDGIKRANDRVDEERAARELANNRLWDKMDAGFTALRDQMAENHRQTQAGLREVCDKGGQDHARFDGQYQELRAELDMAKATEAGRREVRNAFLKLGGWVVENSRPIAAVVAAGAIGVGIGSIDFSPNHPATAHAQTVATIPPVTNQQETLGQGHAQDWPLRTFSDGVN